MKNFIIAIAIVLFCANAEAADAWKIVKDKSKLTFTATQNDSPVTGEFTGFSGNILFAPGDLKSSNVHIDVDMNSVSASYENVAATLKESDWFNVGLFPKAVFENGNFTLADAAKKLYIADGTLTIRDKKIPLKLNFTLDEYTANKAVAHGFTTIKRNDFGVGQGEWAKTDSVKDEVKIDFTIVAEK